MKKLCLAVAMLLAAVTVAFASDYRLTLVYTDGSIGINLSQNPRITFPDSRLLLTYEDENVEIEFDDFIEWSFTLVTAVEEIETPTMSMNIKPDAIEVFGAAGADILVTNAAGQVVISSKITEGEAVISTSSLPAGVYVAAIGNRIVKFIKK